MCGVRAWQVAALSQMIHTVRSKHCLPSPQVCWVGVTLGWIGLDKVSLCWFTFGWIGFGLVRCG